MAKEPEAIAGLEKMLALARAGGDRRLEGKGLADLAFVIHAFATLLWEHRRIAWQGVRTRPRGRARRGMGTMGSRPDMATRGSVHCAYGAARPGSPLWRESVRLGEPLGTPELYLHGFFYLGRHLHELEGRVPPGDPDLPAE